MATYTKFQQFVEDLAHGVHNFDTNTIKVALSSAANAPSASADAVLADITTVSTANLDDITPMSDRNMRVSTESGEPMSDRNMRVGAQSFAQQQCSRVYVVKKEQ